MLREKAQAAPTARPKVPMRRLGADCFVVAMKRGNARGAKGAVNLSIHTARVTARGCRLPLIVGFLPLPVDSIPLAMTRGVGDRRHLRLRTAAGWHVLC